MENGTLKVVVIVMAFHKKNVKRLQLFLNFSFCCRCSLSLKLYGGWEYSDLTKWKINRKCGKIVNDNKEGMQENV